jgi:tetratricopeptide (TPR) repeat protein
MSSTIRKYIGSLFVLLFAFTTVLAQDTSQHRRPDEADLIDMIRGNRLLDAWDVLQDRVQSSPHSTKSVQAFLFVYQMIVVEQSFAELKQSIASAQTIDELRHLYGRLHEMRGVLNDMSSLVEGDLFDALGQRRDNMVADMKEEQGKAEVLTLLTKADEAEKRGDYRTARSLLIDAAKINEGISLRVDQINLFISIIESCEKKEYDSALKTFEKIPHDSRYYVVASSYVKKIIDVIKGKEYISLVDQTLGADPFSPKREQLSKLISHTSKVLDRSDNIREVARYVDPLVKALEKHLSLSSNDLDGESNIIAALKSLGEIEKLHGDVLDAVSKWYPGHVNRHKGFTKWTCAEREKWLKPLAERVARAAERITTLKEAYLKHPITKAEIQGWHVATDYNNIANRVKQLTEMNRGIIPMPKLIDLLENGDLKKRVLALVDWVKGTTVSVSENIFGRAYTLEMNMGDVELALKLYAIVLYLPGKASEQADRRIKVIKRRADR